MRGEGMMLREVGEVRLFGVLRRRRRDVGFYNIILLGFFSLWTPSLPSLLVSLQLGVIIL